MYAYIVCKHRLQYAAFWSDSGSVIANGDR